MKKLTVILPLALILCFMVCCQDKEAMAELEEFKTQAEVEEQNEALYRGIIEEINKGNSEYFNEFYFLTLFTTFHQIIPSPCPEKNHKNLLRDFSKHFQI